MAFGSVSPHKNVYSGIARSSRSAFETVQSAEQSSHSVRFTPGAYTLHNIPTAVSPEAILSTGSCQLTTPTMSPLKSSAKKRIHDRSPSGQTGPAAKRKYKVDNDQSHSGAKRRSYQSVMQPLTEGPLFLPSTAKSRFPAGPTADMPYSTTPVSSVFQVGPLCEFAHQPTYYSQPMSLLPSKKAFDWNPSLATFNGPVGHYLGKPLGPDGTVQGGPPMGVPPSCPPGQFEWSPIIAFPRVMEKESGDMHTRSPEEVKVYGTDFQVVNQAVTLPNLLQFSQILNKISQLPSGLLQPANHVAGCRCYPGLAGYGMPIYPPSSTPVPNTMYGYKSSPPTQWSQPEELAEPTPAPPVSVPPAMSNNPQHLTVLSEVTHKAEIGVDRLRGLSLDSMMKKDIVMNSKSSDTFGDILIDMCPRVVSPLHLPEIDDSLSWDPVLSDIDEKSEEAWFESDHSWSDELL